MTQTNKHPKVVIAAIAGLVILEVVALLSGVNGTLYSLVLAAIAGLGGWTLSQRNNKK